MTFVGGSFEDFAVVQACCVNFYTTGLYYIIEYLIGLCYTKVTNEKGDEESCMKGGKRCLW